VSQLQQVAQGLLQLPCPRGRASAHAQPVEVDLGAGPIGRILEPEVACALEFGPLGRLGRPRTDPRWPQDAELPVPAGRYIDLIEMSSTRNVIDPHESDIFLYSVADPHLGTSILLRGSHLMATPAAVSSLASDSTIFGFIAESGSVL
jgi:hypothetical protein